MRAHRDNNRRDLGAAFENQLMAVGTVASVLKPQDSTAQITPKHGET